MKIPGLEPEIVVQDPIPAPGTQPAFDIRAELAIAHRRLPDHEAQRRLLERLRYKHVGTLSSYLQNVGDQARSAPRRWIFRVVMGSILLVYLVRFVVLLYR